MFIKYFLSLNLNLAKSDRLFKSSKYYSHSLFYFQLMFMTLMFLPFHFLQKRLKRLNRPKRRDTVSEAFGINQVNELKNPLSTNTPDILSQDNCIKLSSANDAITFEHLAAKWAVYIFRRLLRSPIHFLLFSGLALLSIFNLYSKWTYVLMYMQMVQTRVPARKAYILPTLPKIKDIIRFSFSFNRPIDAFVLDRGQLKLDDQS